MRLSRRLLVSALVISLVGAPSSASEPDASHPPATSGPLIGVALPCEDNGRAKRNEVKGQSCSWSYELLPAESDISNDYWAYWFQMEIDPGKGWCAKQLRFDMEAPEDAKIISATPDEDRRIRSSSVTTTEFVVDGGGSAPMPGTIAQNVLEVPGRVKVALSENQYSYEWRGNSRDKLVVAIGIQLSTRRVPPEVMTTWSEGEGAAMGSCRPVRIHVMPQ